jgi:hypothetical protein
LVYAVARNFLAEPACHALSCASCRRVRCGVVDRVHGRLESGRPGTPIPLATLKTMDDRRVAATFGNPVFQRDDNGVVRLLRFRSDACDLDLFLYAAGGAWQVRHAEARDRTLRAVPVDRCAGSVAAQRR